MNFFRRHKEKRYIVKTWETSYSKSGSIGDKDMKREREREREAIKTWQVSPQHKGISVFEDKRERERKW